MRHWNALQVAQVQATVLDSGAEIGLAVQGSPGRWIASAYFRPQGRTKVLFDLMQGVTPIANVGMSLPPDPCGSQPLSNVDGYGFDVLDPDPVGRAHP